VACGEVAWRVSRGYLAEEKSGRGEKLGGGGVEQWGRVPAHAQPRRGKGRGKGVWPLPMSDGRPTSA
jgi:hypothetical protein